MFALVCVKSKLAESVKYGVLIEAKNMSEIQSYVTKTYSSITYDVTTVIGVKSKEDGYLELQKINLEYSIFPPAEFKTVSI